MAERKKVLVRGLSSSADQEDVSMIFESATYCPQGGDVDSVELREDGVAIITFEDPAVADALIHSRTLMFGKRELKMERYVERQKSESHCQMSRQESSSSSSAEEDNQEALRRSSSLFFDRDETLAEGLENVPKKKASYSMAENDSPSVYFKNDPDGNLGEEEGVKSSMLLDRSMTPTNKDEITVPAQERQSSPSGSDDTQGSSVVETVYFSVQQLRLLALLLHSELRELSDSTEVDVANKCIYIRGPVIMSTQCRIYESLQNSSNERVELTSNLIRLFQTEAGRVWLESILSENKVSAVVYMTEDTGYIIAKDDESLEAARQVIQMSVASERLTVDYSSRVFVSSATFTKVVDEFQKNKIVAIETDRNCVTVEGNDEDVQLVARELRTLLNNNSQAKVIVDLKSAAQRRLLEVHHGAKIRDYLKSSSLATNASVDISFTDTSVEISGPKVMVDWAEVEMQQKYLAKIHTEDFPVNKPGVKMTDFQNKDCDEGKLLIDLENKNLCVVQLLPLVQPKSEASTTIAAAATAVVAAVSSSGVKAISVAVTSAASMASTTTGYIRGFLAVVTGGTSKAGSAASKVTITVRNGSLVEFKEADILVNLITRNTASLKDAGIVSKSFANAELQTALDAVGWPVEFGTDVSVTPASSNLKAKKVFHAAIRKYRNSKSAEILFDLIVLCLEMTIEEKLTSIAFPTLGCGKLGFAPNIVSDCFNRAAQEFDHKIHIYIVAFEKSLFDYFQTSCNSAQAPPPLAPPPPLTTAQQPTSATAAATAGPAATASAIPAATAPSPAPTPAAAIAASVPVTVAAAVPAVIPLVADWSLPCVHKGIVFRIYSLDDKAADKVKEKLIKFFTYQVITKKIVSEGLESLSEEVRREMKCLVSEDVQIDIDHRAGAVVLTGKLVPLKGASRKIKELLKKDKKLHNFEIIRKKDGVQGYLRALAQHEEPDFPKYWTHYKGPCRVASSGATPQRSELKSTSPLYIAINNLIQGTWDDAKACQGKDAVNLTHKTIGVKKIWVIENPSLYQKYLTQKRYLCGRACDKLFPKIDGLDGETEINTRKLGMTVLNENLEAEINEYYLIHGTNEVYVKSIETQGIDSRFAGDKTMFGRGAYYAESSTKADQYADPKIARVGKNQPLHMFVVRVPLGRTYLAREPCGFKKAPCALATCHKDDCSDFSHGICDSVIGTHRDVNKTRLIFREFIVYHPDQGYPEFLVQYERL